MTYADGQPIHLNDRVTLPGDDGGIVVACIESAAFSVDYPSEQWAYLGRGALVLFPKFGLIHYSEVEPDLTLLGRASSSE
jgi:hypothetical protein